MEPTKILPIVDTAPLPKSKLFFDIRGRRFARWTVYGFAGQTKVGQCRWHCICECGTRKVVTGWLLIKGVSRSCGCLQREETSRRAHKHGMSGAPEHMAWKAIKQRCFNPNYQEWEYYGGRGITMAPEWIDDFPEFFSHVGPRPGNDFSLDRINNDGDYEPGNVRWAKRATQSRNRRNAVIVTLNRVRMHLTDAIKKAPITMQTYRRRLKLGWTRDEAISIPPHHLPPRLRFLTDGFNTETRT